MPLLLLVSYPSLDMLVPKATQNSKARSNRNSNCSSLQSSVVLLPAIAVVSPHSNRHEVKPALALKLLKDIERSVLVWQAELRWVVKAIDSLHAQGPMVDGWLESSLEAVPPIRPVGECTETTLLRHGDADALMQYVEALEHHELRQSSGASSERREGRSAEALYRLCWLSDEGKVQSQVCPPEQMGMVSTAIARYQKCKQLLAQQHQLESCLQAAVDGLTSVRCTAQHSS